MTTTVMILGSPNKNGNSATIANAVAEGAKSKGNEIKTFFLNELKNAKGCQSCYGCKKNVGCVQKDDLAPILKAIREADSLIIATPLYFGFSSAQYRLLEDRFFSFIDASFVPNIKAGKKIAVVQTCGSGLDEAKKNAEAIETVWKAYFKADVVGKIVKGYGPGIGADQDANALAEAKELGKKL